MSQAYEDRREFQRSFWIYKEWYTFEDSIFRFNNQKAVSQAEIRYNYEKQKLADQLAYEQQLVEQQLRSERHIYLLIGSFLLVILAFLFISKNRIDRSEQERMLLLHKIELLKERLAGQPFSTTSPQPQLSLDREKLETFIDRPLGDSSWSILNVLFNEPSIANKEIAKQVSLSVEGVSSSLQHMYKTFDIQTESSQNKKVALVTKVVRISLEE